MPQHCGEARLYSDSSANPAATDGDLEVSGTGTVKAWI
jgi:hypothetical protein